MPAIERILWVVLPAAAYFLFLGDRRSGRNARVIAGAVDAAWLVFGFGGFIVFGPIGQTLGSLARNRWTSAALVIAAMLLAAAWILQGRRRLVVYNVSAETFLQALDEAIESTPGNFVRTLRGYEEPHARLTLIARVSQRSRIAEIKAEGPGCEGRLAELEPRLRKSLAGRPDPRPTIAWNDFVFANLILAAPIVLLLLLRPDAQRDLGRWIQGILRPVVKSPPEAGRSRR